MSTWERFQSFQKNNSTMFKDRFHGSGVERKQRKSSIPIYSIRFLTQSQYAPAKRVSIRKLHNNVVTSISRKKLRQELAKEKLANLNVVSVVASSMKKKKRASVQKSHGVVGSIKNGKLTLMDPNNQNLLLKPMYSDVLGDFEQEFTPVALNSYSSILPFRMENQKGYCNVFTNESILRSARSHRPATDEFRSMSSQYLHNPKRASLESSAYLMHVYRNSNKKSQPFKLPTINEEIQDFWKFSTYSSVYGLHS